MDTPTFGQKAVGLDFNPSGNPEVIRCKQMFADIIDQMENLRRAHPHTEQARIASIAITNAQTAQMWAVKGLTLSPAPVDLPADYVTSPPPECPPEPAASST